MVLLLFCKDLVYLQLKKGDLKLRPESNTRSNVVTPTLILAAANPAVMASLSFYMEMGILV